MSKIRWFGDEPFEVISFEELDKKIAHILKMKCAPSTFSLPENEKGKICGCVMTFDKVITMAADCTTSTYQPLPHGSAPAEDIVCRDVRAVRVTVQLLKETFATIFGPNKSLKEVNVTFTIEDKNVISYNVTLNYKF